MALADSSKFEVKANDDAKDAKWFAIEYKLINTDKQNTKNGYINRKIYQLSLTEDETIEALIEVIVTVEGRNTSVKKVIKESGKLAFDHALAISYGIERLRNKIEYTDIVFSLMPEKFTLTELQQVYEVILDKQLLKANFRRKIADMVIETNDYTKDKGHRPSKLYRYNPNWVDEHSERRN